VWYQDNNLSLHKTKKLIVGYRKQGGVHPPFTSMSTVERIKFLSVHIIEDLVWSSHTRAVEGQATPLLPREDEITWHGPSDPQEHLLLHH
jgi:hypothetical protein